MTMKSLLAKLFLIDELRRVGVESILPLITKKTLDLKKEKYREELKKKCDVSEEVVGSVMEMELWEYDDFDDYIEVIFQYFYIVVFAAIFPLAAPLSLAFNMVEIRSDKFKIT